MKFVSPSIITNGLVACYDAANVKSYPGSGTNLVDLGGGGFNGTLVNGVGFSNANAGQLTFAGTGSNQYVSTSYTTALNDFTVGVWFKVPDSSNAAFARLVDKDYVNGFWLGKEDGATPHKWGGGVQEIVGPYGIYLSGLTDGLWHYLVSIRSGTTHTLYGDGITNTISNTVPSTALNTVSLSLGRDNVSSPDQMLKGSIALVQVYNRALSSTEVLQNFNATRGRFGI